MKTHLPWLITAMTFLFILNSNAQNLVVNGSLDIQIMCPSSGQIVNATSWNSPTNFSADLMNDTCPTQNMAGHTGHGCAGIYTYNGLPDQRQYIQGQLSASLIAGQQYNISFWVLRINNHWACDRMGAYLSVGSVSQPIMTNLAFIPQVDHPSGQALNSNSWQQISGTFVAAGGEDHILIGSFYPDVQITLYIANASSSSYTAYYKVDDISVTAVTSDIAEPQLSDVDLKVFPQPSAGFITIQYPAGWPLRSAKLADVAGRQISVTTVTGIAGEARIPLENIPPGVYFLTLESAHAVINKKIIVSGN